MKFKPYYPIKSYNDICFDDAKKHPDYYRPSWVVTEYIHGLHLALYFDNFNFSYMAANRQGFLLPKVSYANHENIMDLHGDWIQDLSLDLKSPIIVYGVMVGGHYQGKQEGVNIPSACEYCPKNEYIIHDIYIVEKQHHMNIFNLESRGIKHNFITAPIVKTGATNYMVSDAPCNNLSMIPFIKELPINYSNEMAGIVVRPVMELAMNGKPIMAKKMNPSYVVKESPIKYLSKKQEKRKGSPYIITAQEMEITAMQEKLFDAVLKNVTINPKTVTELSHKYVKAIMINIAHIKYQLMSKAERRLVHKELNRLALYRLNSLLKMVA